MVKLARPSDLLLAAFLIAITALLLVPLPTVLLDFLLVINLSFSVILLLAGLYLPNALALLSFPSILLLTTLFRVSLNVASTRLILSQGEAGQVIRSFGTFLIRGEIVVGLIIFLILTVVNFIVVSRGAARVSEVAARFALDALPGKQMAIDSDLRSGLISAIDAQRRREDLRKESQLYGSMDGAMKFVQGDAIAGLFIIAVNILGGIYLGMTRGFSFSDAVSTYTTLTVGDGLVHQIPAILISISAGIVVTRVSSGEGTSLGTDVQSQLFARPGTTLFAGLLIAAIGVVPGLPPLPFLVVGVVLMIAGARQLRASQVRGSGSALAAERDSAGLPVGRNTTSIVISDTPPSLLLGLDATRDENSQILRVTLDAGGLYRSYREDQARYRLWWQQLEADFFAETGLELPTVKVSSSSMMPFCHFQMAVRGTVVIDESIIPDAFVVEVSPHAAPSFGLEVLEEVAHPLSGNVVSWVSLEDSDRRVLEAAGIAVYDPFQYIGLRAAAFFSSVPEELLSVAEVIEIENRLEKKYPGLLSRTVNREFLTPARFAELLQELVREGVSVADTKQIVEAVASYCSSVGAALVADGEFELEEVVSFVRAARRRHIVGQLLSPRRTLRVATIAESTEELLSEIPATAPNRVPAVSPENSEKLGKAFQDAFVSIQQRGLGAVAVLVNADFRARLVAFLRHSGLRAHVITHDELDAGVRIEPVGAVRV